MGPGPGELRLAVDACGICGSDLHEYVAGPITVPEEPHPVTGEQLPLPMGHEFTGEVIETGEHDSDIEVGDRVAVNPIQYCGDCRYCREAKYNICESIGFFGLTGGGGGFSEEAVVPAEQAVPFPDDLPAEYGALVEPFSVGLHAVDLADLSPGASVAVFGTGPIGLTIVQCARAAGAGEIYAVEPREHRRSIAGDSGADVTLDPSETETVEELLAESDGGVDVVFEVAGVEQAFRDAVRTVKHDGRVIVVSLFEETVEFNPTDIVTTERTVSGSAAFHGGSLSHRDFGAVIGMFSEGLLDPESLITGRIGLDGIVDGGFEALEDPSKDHIKIIVEPSP